MSFTHPTITKPKDVSNQKSLSLTPEERHRGIIKIWCEVCRASTKHQTVAKGNTIRIVWRKDRYRRKNKVKRTIQIIKKGEPLLPYFLGGINKKHSRKCLGCGNITEF